MLKLLNLDALINRKMEVQIGGEVLHLQEPTMNDFELMLEIEQLEGKVAIKKQKDWLLTLLNRNDEGKSFDEAYVKTLPRAAVVAFWRHVSAQCNQTITEKN